MNGTRNCPYPDCDRPSDPKCGGGMCSPHYQRVRRRGEPWPSERVNERRVPGSQPFPLSPLALKRFLSKVSVNENGCWLWTARISQAGYGMFRADKLRSAHRVSYLHHRGPVPEGLVLDHLCRVRNCVNPEHLEVVTGWENWARGQGPARINKAKTHCIRGHAFTPDNTRAQGVRGRACIACERRDLECETCGAIVARANLARHRRRHKELHVE